MREDQKTRFSLMRERENLIGKWKTLSSLPILAQKTCKWPSFLDKDVQRTDRTHPYFVGDDNVNLTTMREILMTYNMYDFNLGYVQGMSDLLAPIMVVMDNEVDSFWCLVGYMEKIVSWILLFSLIKLITRWLIGGLVWKGSKLCDGPGSYQKPAG